MTVAFELNGAEVELPDGERSLLEALRDELGTTSPKDGCSPQGQCGCCTVLIDGSPRVACVTPVNRVRGRQVTTVEGLPDAEQWAHAFSLTGASQCGFCTPGIITRLSQVDPADLTDRAVVDKALLAHLCRCTGWQTIRDACAVVAGQPSSVPVRITTDRSIELAERRAELEGGAAQSVGDDVALGRGGFADDSAPSGSLVAVSDETGEWVVGASLSEARRRAGKVQGRRTTAPVEWPIELPAGSWHLAMQTTWVEPAYLEPDAAWCAPGGTPTSPLGNGGAFGGKSESSVAVVARRLADEHGHTVRVLASREDTVRLGPKRPPLAVGVDASGRGVVRFARPTSLDHEAVILDGVASVAPGVTVEFVDVAGPPTSSALRGAGWAEIGAVVASALGRTEITSPAGATAAASIDDDGTVRITVDAGAPLDDVVLRSYCIGAAHMALGMVRSESIALDAEGQPLDLTIRSFGVLRAVDTPDIIVDIVEGTGSPVNGSDAVFAAVLSAAWRHAGAPRRIPTSS